MKKVRFWMVLALAVTMLSAPVALAQESDDGSSLGQWLDGAVSSVETWARNGGILEVRGQAVRTVAPDTVSISVGATVQDEEVKKAQDAANTIINDVIAELETLGVAENQMVTSGYNLSRRFDYSSDIPKVIGYEASISLRVTVKDFDLINTILDTAVDKGANDIGGISFSYSDEGTIYRQALSDAITVAQAKAASMAETAGVQTYTLLEMREGSNNVGAQYAMNSYMMAEGSAAGGGGSQIKSGEIEVTAYVTLIYQIK